MIKRIPTGIPGLDELIEGGLPQGSITLISGTPGTGKSILCSQIAFKNALKGKKVLYLNLEQNEGRLEEQMLQFNWNPEKVKNNLKIVSVDSSDSQLIEYVLTEIKKLNYDLIVLDSLDSITSTQLPSEQNMGMQKIAETVIPTIFDAPTIGRLKLKKIFTAITKSKATALLTSERIKDSKGITRDTISEFLSDAIILLQSEDLADEKVRTLMIEKMRLTKIKGGTYSFDFSNKGIKVIKSNE